MISLRLATTSRAAFVGDERRTAIYSKCEQYRFTLTARWDRSKPYVQFIGLNPSTATELKDDNTVRRCNRFARAWGFGGMIMTNLFAYRSTDPQGMLTHVEPPQNVHYNDEALRLAAEDAGLIVACWGNHGEHLGRGEYVRQMFRGQLKCFGLTKQGHPKHPLYLSKKTELIDYI